MNNGSDPTTPELQQQIHDLREQIKERDPSVLSAIRTVLTDVAAWQAGQRDFPRAAFMGLAFAYLRPRIILAIGSIAAVVIAVAQLWLIKGQNEILSEQGQLLRVQTVGQILQQLRTQDPSASSNSAIVAIFGSVTYDVAHGLALKGPIIDLGKPRASNSDLNAWMNSALILLDQSQRLTLAEQRSLRLQLIAQFNAIRHHMYFTKLRLKETEDGSYWSESERDERRKGLDYHAGLLHTIDDMLDQLDESAPLQTSGYASLPNEEKERHLQQIRSYFLLEFDRAPLDQHFAPTEIDRHLLSLCRAMGNGKIRLPDYYLGVSLKQALQQIDDTVPPSESAQTMAWPILYSWCGLDPDKLEESERLIDKAIPQPEL